MRSSEEIQALLEAVQAETKALPEFNAFNESNEDVIAGNEKLEAMLNQLVDSEDDSEKELLLSEFQVDADGDDDEDRIAELEAWLRGESSDLNDYLN